MGHLLQQRLFTVCRLVGIYICFAYVINDSNALALQINDMPTPDPIYDRFYQPSAPTDPPKDFIGQDYDWSGIGRAADTAAWAIMISDTYYLTVAHYHPLDGSTVVFYSGNDLSQPSFSAAVERGDAFQTGFDVGAGPDLTIGKLAVAPPSSIKRYPLFSAQLGASPPSYELPQTFIVGAHPNSTSFNMAVGRNEITTGYNTDHLTWTYDTDGTGLGNGEAQTVGGDSGGPTFNVVSGQLAIAGTHSQINNDQNVSYNLQDILSHIPEQVAIATFTTPSVPSADNEWIGPTTENWNNASNWSTNAVPTSSQTVWVNNWPSVSTTASCKNLFVGVGPDVDVPSITIGQGGALTIADTLYLGAESDHVGNLFQTGPSGSNSTVSARIEYIGFHGTGSYFHAAGANNASSAIYVGEYGGSADSPSTYTMGKHTVSNAGNGRVVTPLLVIGGGAGSFGKFEIKSGGSQTVTATKIIVGDEGNGTFIQSGGTVTANSLVVDAQASGSGNYTLNNGTLSTETLTINSGGSFDVYGGVLEFRPSYNLSSGTVDLHGSSARVQTSNGIADLRFLAFQNNANANFYVSDDSLAIVTSNYWTTSQLSNPSALPPHIEHTTLNFDTSGFRAGFGTIGDPVVLSGTGHITTAAGGNVTLGNGLTVSGGSPTLTAESGTLGSAPGYFSIYAPNVVGSPAIDVQNGAELNASGTFTLGDFGADHDAQFKIESGGTLKIGPTSTSLDISGKLNVQTGGRVVMHVSSSGADRLNLSGEDASAPQLDGTLAINVPSSAIPSHGAINVLARLGNTNWAISPFGSVVAGLDGNFSSGIIVNTGSGESIDDEAMAVLYPKDFSRFGIVPTSSDCTTGNCIVERATLPADLNGDNKVDFNDYQILSVNYLQPGRFTYADGDLNGDGHVDFNDYQILFTHWLLSWSSGLTGGNVPEPATVSLIGLALVGGFGLSRRRH
jgi:hypothetical protein